MQHSNSVFNKLKVDDSTYVKNVDSLRNMKKIPKLFKYNCKILSCICFGILSPPFMSNVVPTIVHYKYPSSLDLGTLF
jgi:hypothetical protein